MLHAKQMQAMHASHVDDMQVKNIIINKKKNRGVRDRGCVCVCVCVCVRGGGQNMEEAILAFPGTLSTMTSYALYYDVIRPLL